MKINWITHVLFATAALIVVGAAFDPEQREHLVGWGFLALCLIGIGWDLQHSRGGWKA